MHQPERSSRRRFLQSTGTAVAAAGVAGAAVPIHATADTPRIKKAVKFGMVRGPMSMVEKFKLLESLGFDGVELNSPNDYTLADVLRARDDSGLPIHGIVDSVHWRQRLSDPDPAVRAKGLAGLKTALRDAKAYGATTVLLVPGRVTKTDSYDQVYRRSQAEIRKALPLAAELNIKIGIENVWNDFLLSPLETARYIDELGSPMLGAYFDVGNVVRYGWPEHWIRVLGRRIIKLDIKEFSRVKSDEEGLRRGFRVKLLEGDCDWPAVMAALREINYPGWGTAEIPGGQRDRLQEIAERMDRIFAS